MYGSKALRLRVLVPRNAYLVNPSYRSLPRNFYSLDSSLQLDLFIYLRNRKLYQWPPGGPVPPAVADQWCPASLLLFIRSPDPPRPPRCLHSLGLRGALGPAGPGPVRGVARRGGSDRQLVRQACAREVHGCVEFLPLRR